ncbi:hypothetical protein ACSBR1_008561 [Camellia fascicularis]
MGVVELFSAGVDGGRANGGACCVAFCGGGRSLIGKGGGLTDVARGLGYVESEVGIVGQEFAQPNPGGSASGKPSNTNPDLSLVFALLRDRVGCCLIVNALGVSVEDTPLHERVAGGRPVGMSPSSGSAVTGSQSYHAQLHQVGAMAEGQSHDEGGCKDRREAVDMQTEGRWVDVGDELALVVRPENFLVDIKGPALAFLPILSFEGGTRRNIPKFEVGTLIDVRVVKANTGMNPELSCTDDWFSFWTSNSILYIASMCCRLFTSTGKAAEYGSLKDGFTFESSTGLARMLLSSPTCPVLEGLGKKLSFEIAVGLNGRVWVNAEAPSTIILVSNAIMNSESLSGVQQKIMVEKLLQRVQ